MDGLGGLRQAYFKRELCPGLLRREQAAKCVVPVPHLVASPAFFRPLCHNLQQFFYAAFGLCVARNVAEVFPVPGECVRLAQTALAWAFAVFPGASIQNITHAMSSSCKMKRNALEGLPCCLFTCAARTRQTIHKTQFCVVRLPSKRQHCVRHKNNQKRVKASGWASKFFTCCPPGQAAAGSGQIGAGTSLFCFRMSPQRRRRSCSRKEHLVA